MGVAERLRAFRERDGLSRWDNWLTWPLIALGLLFLVVLILPLAQPLTPKEASALRVANVAIWAAFVVDYLARLYLSLERAQFVRTHVFDLIVIAVPFLRPFRLLRLVAIVASTTRRAGGLVVRRVTLYVLGVAVVVMAVSAVVVYDAEQHAAGANITTLSEAFWWAMTTVTTVGYGDHYPVTSSGQIMASVLMVTGIALLGTLTAAVAAWFVDAVRRASTADGDEAATAERADLHAELAALRQSVDELRAELRAARGGAPGG